MPGEVGMLVSTGADDGLGERKSLTCSLVSQLKCRRYCPKSDG